MRKKPDISTEAKQRIIEGARKSGQIRKLQSQEIRLLYKDSPKFCENENCQNILSFERRMKKFCSRSCSVSTLNLGRSRGQIAVKKNCLECEKITINKKFCSRKCNTNFTYKENIEKWLAGQIAGGDYHGVSPFVRKYLINERGNKCENCGWSEINLVTNKIPIQIHHFDDPLNHSVNNLQLLCPSCHSLTPNFGRHGKGRKQRYNK